MAQRKFIIDGGFKTDDASELLANLTMGGTIDMDSNKILNVAAATANTDATNKAYVDAAVASVIDSAPGALDTLNELAAAMGDDANFATTMTNSLATKAAITYVDAQITATEGYATTGDAAVTTAFQAADTALVTAQNTAWAAADAAQTTNLQTYADTAETDAIAAAASAAALADTASANTINAAWAAADTAQTTSINTAWAAGDAAVTTAMQTYADTAESDAVATAAADATTKANAAQAAAEATASADATAKVAALVDSAPGTLDTLNELAAALGDDANYAASVTAAISAAQTAAQNYADANDANDNTTYTAGNGMTLSGTEFLMSGSYTGSFTATGDITAYSDESLKTNIQVIDGALGRVEAIRGVTFDRIEDGSTSTGVVAHELEAVLPEAVHTDVNGLKSVAYGNITGLLIEAVKELSAQVAELKAK
jgi:chemotaxis protein histidine kinase CheA